MLPTSLLGTKKLTYVKVIRLERAVTLDNYNRSIINVGRVLTQEVSVGLCVIALGWKVGRKGKGVCPGYQVCEPR